MRSRISLPQLGEMTDAQRVVHDSILTTRPNIQGPFLAWLHRPELAAHAEKLGAYCRFGTCLSLLESERMILMTAAHFKCRGEWAIHKPIAEREGLPSSEIEAIEAGDRPAASSPRDQALIDFCWDLLKTQRIPDESFARAEKELGLDGLVDAAGIIGYYSMVAMTLNAFEMAPD